EGRVLVGATTGANRLGSEADGRREGDDERPDEDGRRDAPPDHPSEPGPRSAHLASIPPIGSTGSIASSPGPIGGPSVVLWTQPSVPRGVRTRMNPEAGSRTSTSSFALSWPISALRIASGASDRRTRR